MSNPLNKHSIERYSRQIVLKDIGVLIQYSLKDFLGLFRGDLRARTGDTFNSHKLASNQHHNNTQYCLFHNDFLFDFSHHNFREVTDFNFQTVSANSVREVHHAGRAGSGDDIGLSTFDILDLPIHYLL